MKCDITCRYTYYKKKKVASFWLALMKRHYAIFSRVVRVFDYNIAVVVWHSKIDVKFVLKYL